MRTFCLRLTEDSGAHRRVGAMRNVALPLLARQVAPSDGARVGCPRGDRGRPYVAGAVAVRDDEVRAVGREPRGSPLARVALERRTVLLERGSVPDLRRPVRAACG